MKKKLILLCFIFVFAASFPLGCSKETIGNIQANELSLKVAISPNGSRNDTYLFNLKSGSKLEVLLGNRKSDDLWTVGNYVITEIGEKQLNKEQFNNVVALCNDIYKDKYLLQNEKEIQLDSWEVVVVINDRTFNYYYGDQNKGSLGELVKLLINISPIKVDLHGLS